MKLSVTAGSIFALALTMIIPLHGNDWAFTGIIPGGHRGQVNALVYKGDIILSAGEDGFLQIWKTGSSDGQAQERFQISPYRIIAMAGRPGKDEACFIESDAMGLYRISAWNYRERRNLFTLRLREAPGYIAYSMGGNFIMTAGTGRAGLLFFDSASGSALPSPPSLAGTISLAVTGRSERNMLIYLASGTLSYWDIESGNETNRFNVPSQLSSPALFSNNRYLAGINSEGLAVINAVSGELVARDRSVPGGSLLCSAGDDFICLIQKDEAERVMYRYTIDSAGRLAATGYIPLPASGNGANARFTAIAAQGNAVALGTSGGSLMLADMNGRLQNLAIQEQVSVTDAEVSGQSIALLAENGTMGFIPLHYSQFTSGRTIRLEQNQQAYNRITAFAEGEGGGKFVFWQEGKTRTQPVILTAGTGNVKQELGDITFRSPIRSADSLGGKILFRDSAGNITVIAPGDSPLSSPFTFFSVGLMDAAFVDHSRIIICRSAVSGNTPFMLININTGETVPLPYPSRAGVIVQRGTSGSIYAGAISARLPAGEAEEIRTLIFQLDPSNIAEPTTLVDFQGEDTQFSLAESPGGTAGSLAATIGGENASIYSAAGTQALERTNGLPFKLINGGSYLISLDSAGSVCWHDGYNGKLLAVFRLHPNSWTLQTEQRTISGQVVVD